MCARNASQVARGILGRSMSKGGILSAAEPDEEPAAAADEPLAWLCPPLWPPWLAWPWPICTPELPDMETILLQFFSLASENDSTQIKEER